MLLHHLVGDHTTLRGLAETRSRRICAARREALPAPVPFRNFVAQARLGVSREEHEAFFRAMLGDVDEPTAPFGLLDVQGDGRRIEEAHQPVEPRVGAAACAPAARAEGVSAASLCHLAWAQVLARVTGRGDVVFGTVLFGRMQGGEGADRALGLFINTLPVRIRVGRRWRPGERAPDACAAGRAAAPRARVAGAGAALQRRAGAGAAVHRAAELPPQCGRAAKHRGGAAVGRSLDRHRAGIRRRSAPTIRSRLSVDDLGDAVHR